MQGAPKMDLIASRAALLAEVQTARFQEYAKAVLRNAKALERGLLSAGATLVSGGTSSHLLLLNLLRCGTSGNEIEKSLLAAQVVANKNPIPFDTLPSSKAGGLRIGSAALTTRGFDDEQFFELGVMIAKVVISLSNSERVAELRSFVKQNTQGLPLFNEKWVA